MIAIQEKCLVCGCIFLRGPWPQRMCTECEICGPQVMWQESKHFVRARRKVDVI